MNDLTTLVRRSLDERSGDVPAVPPAWDRISAGLRAVRRRRRRRAAGLVGAVAAVAVLGAVLGGVTPASLRRSGPATPDARVVPDSVFGGRTVGSLAKDAAFLDDLRREIISAGVIFGGSAPASGRREDVLVPFVGDVGDARIALLEMRSTGDDGVKDRFVWLVAPVGASARQLARSEFGNEEAGPTAALSIAGADMGTSRASQGVGALVVLSANGRTEPLTIAGPPELASDGRFRWALQDLPASSPGHWETAVPWQSSDMSAGFFRIPGQTTWNELAFDLQPGPTLGFASEAALHGGAPARGVAIESALTDAEQNARVDPRQTLRTLLWSGPVGRSTLSVVAVTVPSGAQVVTVHRINTDAPDGASNAGYLLRAAGPLASLCLAMQTGDPETGADPGLFVLGPVGAVRAVVAGQPPGAALRDEAAVLPQAPDATRVDFVGADGTTLCSTSVNATTDRFLPHT